MSYRLRVCILRGYDSMSRFAVLLATVLVTGIGAASAADLQRKAPIAAPVASPVYNWTGFYVGAHAGWIWSDIDVSQNYLPSPAAFGAGPFGYSQDADGGMLGGQIGFNYQISNWVLGIEADLSWTDIGRTTTVTPLLSDLLVVIPGSFHTASVDMNWFATVRGRLGFAANNLLIYVTGGFAFADLDYAVTTSFAATGGPVFAGTASDTRAGWTVGGGFEWGFAPNWSVKGEYLYYDLGDTTVTGPSPTALPIFATVTTFDNTGHILRLGLNYRFGWGGPVVARY